MGLPLPKKKTHLKRLREWEKWLLNFEKVNRNENGASIYNFIPNAAWILNDLYWRLAEQYLRPILKTDPENQEEHRIHPYKIIAASEITVMMTLPIRTEGHLQEKKENALLAWFIATQIMEGWETGGTPLNSEEINQVSFFRESIDDKNVYPEAFMEEHLKWLTYLNVSIEKPLLLLAQCWRLFYFTCLAIAQQGNLK